MVRWIVMARECVGGSATWLARDRAGGVYEESPEVAPAASVPTPYTVGRRECGAGPVVRKT